MQEKQGQYSRDALNNFLDFAGERSLLKKATARARKIASNIILEILDADEAVDLSKVDLEDVIARHRNRAVGKMTPKTLATYESRTRIAVRDFLEYVKNPQSWRPSQQRTRKATKPDQAVAKAKSRTLSGKSESVIESQETATQPSVHIDFQIHISPEATPEQIDKIFASMREHLYPKQND